MKDYDVADDCDDREEELIELLIGVWKWTAKNMLRVEERGKEGRRVLNIDLTTIIVVN